MQRADEVGLARHGGRVQLRHYGDLRCLRGAGLQCEHLHCAFQLILPKHTVQDTWLKLKLPYQSEGESRSLRMNPWWQCQPEFLDLAQDHSFCWSMATAVTSPAVLGRYPFLAPFTAPGSNREASKWPGYRLSDSDLLSKCLRVFN